MRTVDVQSPLDLSDRFNQKVRDSDNQVRVSDKKVRDSDKKVRDSDKK